MLVILCSTVTLFGAACEWFSPAEAPSVPETKGRSVAAREPKPPKDGILASIRKRGEIRVGMQVGYRPFQMAGPEGALIGFDVDAAEAAAHELGAGLRIVRLKWQELLPALAEGKIDVVMSGMTVTPRRNMEAVFTDPVHETGRMFLVHRKNADRFRKPEDLDRPGVFVVARPGGLGEFNSSKSLPKAALREFPDVRNAVKEVVEGRAHAFIDDEFTIRLECARRPDALIGRFEPLTYETVAWALPPGDGHWLNWLNNFIRAAEHDGRLDGWKKRWFRDYYLDMISTTGSTRPKR